MEDYLIDRETLGRFIDNLIKKRPLPIEDVNELNNYRESHMRALDDRISQAIFGSLNAAQTEQLDQLLDRETQNPEVFSQFFQNQGLNIEHIILGTLSDYSKEYLAGGQNA